MDHALPAPRRRARAGRGILIAALLASCDEPAPAPAATSSAIASAAPFSQADVDAVIAQQATRVRERCGPATIGELELMFEIDADGNVTDVAVAGGGAAERILRECIETEARTWKFRAPGKPTTAPASLRVAD